MSVTRLTPDQKAAIVVRYRAGESPSLLAREFGVHSSYPALLSKRRGYPERAAANLKSNLRSLQETRHG